MELIYLGYEGSYNHNGTHWFSFVKKGGVEVGVVEAGTKEQLLSEFRHFVLHYHIKWIDEQLKDIRSRMRDDLK